MRPLKHVGKNCIHDGSFIIGDERDAIMPSISLPARSIIADRSATKLASGGYDEYSVRARRKGRNCDLCAF